MTTLYDNMANEAALIAPHVAEPKVVIDELLAYVFPCMKTCTPTNIKRSVLSHFSRDCITEAKKVLWKECASSQNIEYHQRRDTNSRSQEEANLSDILEAFVEIDRKTDGCFTVIFAASDLSKLPRHSPEELNTVALLQRLESLEKHMDSINNTLSSHQVDVSMLKDKVTEQGDITATHATLIQAVAKSTETCKIGHKNNITKEDTSSSSDYSSDSDDEDEVCSPQDKPSENRKRHHSLPSIGQYNVMKVTEALKPLSLKAPIASEQQTSSHHNKRLKTQKKTFASAVASKPPQGFSKQSFTRSTWSQKRQHDTGFTNRSSPNEEQGFSKQRQQRRRDHKAVQKSSNKKIFIFNVPVENTDSDVKTYLDDARVPYIEVSQVSHPDSRRKSFVISVTSGHGSKLSQNEFWPSGVRCRDFQDRKQ